MIELFGGYAIDADTRQFILVKRIGKDKNGNDTYKQLKYLKTVESCLKALQSIVTREKVKNDTLSLQQAIDEFKAITESVKAIKITPEEAEGLKEQAREALKRQKEGEE